MPPGVGLRPRGCSCRRGLVFTPLARRERPQTIPLESRPRTLYLGQGALPALPPRRLRIVPPAAATNDLALRVVDAVKAWGTNVPHRQSLGCHPGTSFEAPGSQSRPPASPPPTSPPGRVFTMPDFSVHGADPGVHDARSRCSRCPDPGVHDEPIRVFTMPRFPHSITVG